MNRRTFLLWGCIAMASNHAAKGETPISGTQEEDLAWLLANEFEAWHRNLAEKGIIPRAFTGITADGTQAVVILTGLPFDHVQRRDFLIWLCRVEHFAAYAYSTRVGIANEAGDEAREALDIYASSLRMDVTKTLLIDRRGDGHLSLIEQHNAALPLTTDNGPFFGLQRRASVAISNNDEEKFSNLWHEMRPKAFWRSRVSP